MSFEIFGSRFLHGEPAPIAPETLAVAFGAQVVATEPGCQVLAGGATLFCDLQPPGRSSFMIGRPTNDEALWVALLQVLQVPGVVAYAPESPPVVGQLASVAHLPGDLLQAMGPAVVAGSPQELVAALLGPDPTGAPMDAMRA